MTSWKNRVAAALATAAIAASMLPVNARADAAQALTVDKSISVTGLVSGDTATYYQVVEQDANTNAWKLSANVDANGDGKIDGSDYTIDNLVIADAKSADKEVITAEMANKIAAALTTNGASGAAMDVSGTTASKSGVAAGLYMVVAVPGSTNKNTVYKPIFVSADYDANDNTNTYGDIVKDSSDYQDKTGVFKASNLSIDKVAEEVASVSGTEFTDATDGDSDAKGVSVGDVVKMTVTTPLVGYTKNFTNPQFKITDVMTTGLELVSGSIKVSVAGYAEGTNITKGTDYTVTENGTRGYVVAFNKDFLYAVTGAPTVTITYGATVTSSAAAQVNQMDNTVTLNFSNQPTDEAGAGELTDKTRHYTFDIDGDVLGGSESTGGDPTKKRTEEVQKVYLESNETATPSVKATEYDGTKALQGAEFELMVGSATGKKVEWTNNVKSGLSDTSNDSTKIVSDSYGSLVMKGLDEGTYILKETKAPQGYTPDPVSHTIVISATYVDDADGNKILKEYTITVDGNASKYTVELDGATPKELIGDSVGTITVDSNAITTLISNKKLGILPSTGGSGIYFYLVLGGGIAAVSAYLIRRTKEEERQLA